MEYAGSFNPIIILILCKTVDYQARVIKRVKLATYQLGGPQGYQLTRRPFQVTWFLNQFSV
jgi:hypothetical protein